MVRVISALPFDKDTPIEILTSFIACEKIEECVDRDVEHVEILKLYYKGAVSIQHEYGI